MHQPMANHDVLMTDLQQQPPTFEQAAYLLNRMDQQVCVRAFLLVEKRFVGMQPGRNA
jgi:hypothetical protein